MPRYLYYVEPLPWSSILQSLAEDYEVITIKRGAELRLPRFPAVIVADANDDSVEELERLVPLRKPWCTVQLLRSGMPYRGRRRASECSRFCRSKHLSR
jgi:hypothetical protein